MAKKKPPARSQEPFEFVGPSPEGIPLIVSAYLDEARLFLKRRARVGSKKARQDIKVAALRKEGAEFIEAAARELLQAIHGDGGAWSEREKRVAALVFHLVGGAEQFDLAPFIAAGEAHLTQYDGLAATLRRHGTKDDTLRLVAEARAANPDRSWEKLYRDVAGKVALPGGKKKKASAVKRNWLAVPRDERSRLIQESRDRLATGG
jgi:hypothetical protein